MKTNKILVACLPICLLLTACVSYNYPDSPTQRGEEIYQTWDATFHEFTFHYFGSVMLLNEVLQAPTTEQKDSLLKAYFGSYDNLHMYDDGVYILKIYDRLFHYIGYGESYCRILVQTGNQNLYETGVQWSIVINLPEDFVYTPSTTSSNGKQRMASYSPEPMEMGFMYYPYYMPLSITYIGANQFQLKDMEGSETLDYFSVDYTYTFSQREVVPGVVISDRIIADGKGRFSANNGKAIIDYTMNSLEMDKNNLVGGTVELTATERATGKQTSASVECRANDGYKITYEGVTTEHF